MDTSSFTLSQVAYNAHMIGGVIDATSPPDETQAAKQARAAVIVEMFRSFDPANGMEAMIACHCVTLQFVLTAAMHDACDTSLEPAVLARMRASAMSISKMLLLWMSKFEKMHDRNEMRAAETQTLTEPAAAAISTPAPVPAKQPPEDQPRPIAAQPLKTVPPVTGNHPTLAVPPLAVPVPPVPAMKEALLSSAAPIHGELPNGRSHAPAPNRAT